MELHNIVLFLETYYLQTQRKLFEYIYIGFLKFKLMQNGKKPSCYVAETLLIWRETLNNQSGNHKLLLSKSTDQHLMSGNIEHRDNKSLLICNISH